MVGETETTRRDKSMEEVEEVYSAVPRSWSHCCSDLFDWLVPSLTLLLEQDLGARGDLGT